MKELLLMVLTLGFSLLATAQACEKYDRSDYRHWIDADHDCQSTRNEVLIAESLIPVKFKSGVGCKVLSGKWVDPYTGRTFANPRKLDIDHVVPLKEAHDSGAWQWSAAKRKRFANYLKDDDHLIAVYASANRRKGAKDPAEWLPSNQAFLKDYARIWVKIKVDWGLTADCQELRALKRILGGEVVQYPREAPEYVCSKSSAHISTGNTRPADGGIVKKSRSGICHDSSSRHYKRTKRYTSFDSLQECLDSGGRLPKR